MELKNDVLERLLTLWGRHYEDTAPLFDDENHDELTAKRIDLVREIDRMVAQVPNAPWRKALYLHYVRNAQLIDAAQTCQCTIEEFRIRLNCARASIASQLEIDHVNI